MKPFIIFMLMFPSFIYAQSAHWEYSKDGKEDSSWGKTCLTGKHQSPINIKNQGMVGHINDDINIKYGKLSVKNVVNNGHTIQVNINNGGTVTVNKKIYQFLQFHFHTPSEHTLDGKSFPMEVHFVNQYSDTDLLVIGAFIQPGKENSELAKIFKNLPNSEGEKEFKDEINFDKLINSKNGYYHYNGSLTTPPCSEVVEWYVLKSKINLSKNNISDFTKIFPMNTRKTHDINDRKVTEN